MIAIGQSKASSNVPMEIVSWDKKKTERKEVILKKRQALLNTTKDRKLWIIMMPQVLKRVGIYKIFISCITNIFFMSIIKCHH